MKRVKNEVDGIEPFNKFLFRTCYYHQLISGLSSFGISYESLLISSFTFPVKGFELEKIDIPEKELEHMLGYQNRNCNLSKKQLLKNIDKKRPMIVGIDSFYFESRPDTYKKIHTPHFVLVYGYDLENNLLNVVDHAYNNSFEYIKKTIRFDNLLYSNKMLRHGTLARKKSVHVLKMNHKDRCDLVKILRKFDDLHFERAKEAAAFNLERLKELIFQENSEIDSKSPTITRYLQEMKSLFTNLKYIAMFNDNRDRQEDMSIIANAYSNLLSLFWKMESKHDYGFAYRYRESIVRKIDELFNAENRVYDLIMEIYKWPIEQ